MGEYSPASVKVALDTYRQGRQQCQNQDPVAILGFVSQKLPFSVAATMAVAIEAGNPVPWISHF